MLKRLEILYQDQDLIVVNKPAGMLSIPDRFVPEKPNLVHQLSLQFDKVWVVHRIDKETSGAICFALNADAHRALSQQFQNRTIGKKYWALLDGCPTPNTGEIDRAIAPHPTVAGKMLPSSKGKSALTKYELVEEFRYFSLVEAQILTGRTHQIRVHFASIGVPLAVDPLYGKRSELKLSEIKRKNFRMGQEQQERPLMARLSLHAHKLRLEQPSTHQEIEVEASLPKDFRATLNQLRKWGQR